MELHVTPAGNSWQVRDGNEGVVSAPHRRQETAVNAAYDHAKTGDEVVIHRPDGRIREKRTVR